MTDLNKAITNLADTAKKQIDRIGHKLHEINDENKQLRRALDDIKVRSYELGVKELHDMAWHALKEVDDK